MKRACIWALVASLGCSIHVFAGRPLSVDDADPVDVGQVQMATGLSWAKCDIDRNWNFPFNVSYGLASNLELDANFGMQSGGCNDPECGTRREVGCNDLVLGAKWQFLSESDWLPRQALEPSVKIPTASDRKQLGSGRADYDLTWVASKKINEKLQVDLNIGNSLVGRNCDEPMGDMPHGGVALEYSITDSLQWVGEVFGQHELRSGAELTIQDNTGFRWHINNNLTLDAAIGSHIRGDDAPHLILTTGLTWVFDTSRK